MQKKKIINQTVNYIWLTWNLTSYSEHKECAIEQFDFQNL